MITAKSMELVLTGSANQSSKEKVNIVKNDFISHFNPLQTQRKQIADKPKSADEVKRDLGKVGEPLKQNASETLQKTFDQELESTKRRLEAKRDLDMKAIREEIDQELRDFRLDIGQIILKTLRKRLLWVIW